ncbi:hypothetical protein TVAG_329100 [Trichomonas vaginalis G3]|uniref:Uncharacterized protein n=1 Tax=Trichomonas vaginalis (strain ATCC PRA-98 / G3) TaxID=412133 RepID=A2EW51_TRIV3|nr:hypothetical protein TVAGG3_0686770 [Trichomonas vaginalis G3]EAY03137.1 hypothetical protein TVAG_329100 [Trichomonas vaginalis G3]KAI5508275.1 hypothetical protein TVAGG3_0686770 [Trichomonas vaginalis G3]|eukprot:XP_001315360.1 hypothetical protein [Trichomonas vaginalis G3]
MKVQKGLDKDDPNSSIDSLSSPSKSVTNDKLEINLSNEVQQLLDEEKAPPKSPSDHNLTSLLKEVEDSTIIANNESQEQNESKSPEENPQPETQNTTISDNTTDTTLSTLNTKELIQSELSTPVNHENNENQTTTNEVKEQLPDNQENPTISNETTIENTNSTILNETAMNETTNDNENNNELLTTELPIESLNISHNSDKSSDSFPKLPQDCRLNLGGISTLSPSEDQGPCYTYSMPGNLQRIVYHSPDSLICQALAQHQLPLLTKEDKTHLLSDLYKYTSICSSKGLIFEAAYINSVAENLKNSPDYIPTRLDMKRCNENLAYAEQEIKDQTEYWENQTKLIETEYSTGLKELELKLLHEQDMLDHEWQSQKKILKYSKPSPALLNARYSASQLIRQRDFEKAKKAGEVIRTIEKVESAEAEKRMKEGYLAADNLLTKKYEMECSTKGVIREKKLCSAQIAKERSMKPVVKRFQKLTAEKEKLTNIEKSAQLVKTRPVPVIPSDANSPFIDLNSTPKLKLTPITPINRKRSATATGNTSSLQSSRRSKQSMRSPSRLGQRN